MQPIKISILGNYWDSQIYRGRLYLWDMEGKIITVNWDSLIDSIISNPNEKLAFMCSFIRGDYLYNVNFNEFFHDQEIKDILSNKFNNLVNKDIIIEKNQLEKHLIDSQDSPFGELPTDSDIYYNCLYVALDNGLFSTEIHHKTRKHSVYKHVDKLWDCPLLSLKCSNNGRISLSAGNEGLFEYCRLDSKYSIYEDNSKIDNGLYQISPNHSLFSDWLYSSVYSSSNIDDSSLILYSKQSNSNYEKNFTKGKSINQKDIFKKNTHKLSWGANDKIYAVNDDGLLIVKFMQYNVNKNMENDNINNDYLSDVNKINFKEWNGDIINGGASYFGTIIENENSLIVLKSNDEIFIIDGPITKWRVFPRSIRYENQLHVVLEDKIDIFSFNDDYFVNQKEKLSGIFYNNQYRSNRWRNIF